MTRSAIICGGLILIAAAILLSNRWEISVDRQAPSMLVRLDRWTGTARVCFLDTGSGFRQGMEYRCDSKLLSDAQVGIAPKDDWQPVDPKK